MPSMEMRLPWSAVWQISSSKVVNYSGNNRQWLDNLIVSVSTNPGGENPFSVTHATLTGSIGKSISKQPPAIGKYFVQSGPSSFLSMSPAPARAPKVSWDSANLWARTNPARPSMLLPVFWLELREIPEMYFQMGRFLAAGKQWKRYIRTGRHQSRDLATANLAFQFGWAPLLGDLWKCVTFADAVDKRRKEIERAHRSGGYRRRISLGGNSIPLNGSVYANFGSYRNFFVSYTGSSSSKTWAVLKWRPTRPDVGLPSNDSDFRLMLTGLHPSAILLNVWEAMPWSWLIDYFTNVGDVLQAGNHHFMTPNGGSVMTTTTTSVSHPRYTANDDELLPGTARFVDKERSPVGGSADVTARVPILGAGQLSILGSLALIKGRRTLGS